MGREFPAMEDEFELSLELSIGGCYAKSEREKSAAAPPAEIPRSEGETDAAAAEGGGDFADLRRRREMQAVKRREARMKRELKKSRGIGGGEEEEEPARKRGAFGENKVSWGDFGGQAAAAAFLFPVGNGFAWAAAAGEGDERNSGGETAAAASSSAVSQRLSQKGGSSSDTGSHSSSFGTHQDDKVEVNNSSSRAEPPCRSTGTTSREQSTLVQVVADTSKMGEGSPVRAHSNITLTDTTCSTTPTSSVVNAPPPPPKLPASNPRQDGGASAEASPPQMQMPCVSTTGNGPNGRTITGFLYKYTKSEVSIMCVCHGSFFSPAEFVEHAGGVDVTHPLRHITVVPSAVG